MPAALPTIVVSAIIFIVSMADIGKSVVMVGFDGLSDTIHCATTDFARRSSTKLPWSITESS